MSNSQSRTDAEDSGRQGQRAQRVVPIEPEPIITHRETPTQIRCDRDPQKALWHLMEKQKADGALCTEFACMDCMTQWTSGDFAGAYDVETVTCSNCYGTRVLATKVRLEFVTWERHQARK